MNDLNIIKRTAEWVRFLEMAESNVVLARRLDAEWANGAPSITSNVLEFDESNAVIGKRQVTYQYLGHGRCYLSVDGSEAVRVNADTQHVRFEIPGSQRMLEITSLKPLFDRLSVARMLMLSRLAQQGQKTYSTISEIEGTFDKLLEGTLNN